MLFTTNLYISAIRNELLFLGQPDAGSPKLSGPDDMISEFRLLSSQQHHTLDILISASSSVHRDPALCDRRHCCRRPPAIGRMESLREDHPIVPLPRRIRACQACRAKKIRCSDGPPCQYCIRHQLVCTPMPRRQRQYQSQAYQPQRRFSQGPSQREPGLETHRPPLSAPAELPKPTLASPGVSAPSVPAITAGSFVSPSSSSCPPDDLEHSSIYSGDTYFEYRGPRAWLSFCSKPGVEWVATKTGDSAFADIAERCNRDVTRLLKLRDRLPRDRCPDPNPNVAQQFARAYFEGAYEAGFGVVNPTWFHSRLYAHFNSRKEDDEDDHSWYALRNAVFAAGAQIFHANANNPSQALQVSKRYFFNALSVLTDLMIYPASLPGLQALIVMAYFAEGVGVQKLDYPLCMAAVQLAFAKGLHKHPPAAWQLTENEVTHRAWTFWALYCLEKGTSPRGGRPTLIDDGEITCQIPTRSHYDSGTNVAFATAMVKIRRLASYANTALWSTKALTRPAADWITAIQELNHALGLLVGDLRDTVDLHRPISLMDLPEGLSLSQALMVYNAYYMLLFDVHTTVIYPWSRGWSALHAEPAGLAVVETSQSIVAQTCRAIMLASSLIPLEPQCAFLVALYAPLYAMTNLFISILQDPNAPASRDDALLMEVGQGYFARLRLVTGSTIFASLISYIVRTAHRVVQPISPETQDLNLGNNPAQMVNGNMAGGLDIPDLSYPPEAVPGDLIDNFAGFSNCDFEWWDSFCDIQGAGSLFMAT